MVYLCVLFAVYSVVILYSSMVIAKKADEDMERAYKRVKIRPPNE